MSYFKSTRLKSEKNNIWSAFRPLYFILTLFGLLPYSMKFPKGSGGAIIIHKSIYFNSLCSVSVLLILCSFFVLHTQQVFASTESNTMTEVLTTKFNYMFEMLTLILFATVSYYCAYKNRFTYVKILNAVVSSSNKFFDYKVIRRLQMQVKIVALTLFLLLVLQITINFTRLDAVRKMMLVAATFILPQMIQFTVIGFYYVLVLMVVGVLKNINEQMKSLSNCNKINAKFIKAEKKITLNEIEIVYVNMLEMKREINRAFEASILATAIQCFHSIVSEAHILYHGLVVDYTLTTHDVCNCSVWIVYQLLKVHTISCSGSMLKEQVAEIGRSLHNVLAGKEDARMYLEVQHFSSLILFQNAEMTVYDFFPLDATFTFNVVSTAVMYIVMLVQFDTTNNKNP
ncbi:gustatory receptor 68a-like [Leguminivora glycinivorella]|uniref:gustatory receptor 68a-like n=1 Tax=Leguminivora glycinivorella TaxID=1035111 RepID=UPI00200BFD86|nr:gustatory receptor 68a-like [Leguminivora glycinivorella]